MVSEIDNLHFLLMPLMSQSHIIPLIDFAKLLARQGPKVSIIGTPLNAIRYQATIDQAVKSGLEIQLIVLEFPGNETGLPQGCENMDSLTSVDLVPKFFQACEMLSSPLEKLIGELETKPSCIISATALPWTQEGADKFNIPWYVFEPLSCFTLLCSHKLSEGINGESNGSESFLVPDIPHKIEFTEAQLPESTRKPSYLNGVIDQITKAKLSARGTLVNTFEELEPWYVEGYRKETNKVWCIGPVSLCNKNIAEKSCRGNKASIAEHYCISWLDSKEPESVIYACFGSLCHISCHQIKEIGLGLEASNIPFIWIIPGSDSSPEVEKWLEEENFEQRVEGRGLVIRGWAPQVLILSHPSIGGFLTHCGWNSTLEGICAGIPFITWPMFAEQFYNEKLIVHVLKTGVSIGVERSTEPVKWDQVRKSIVKLMDSDEEGKDRRRRSRKLGEMAKKALEQGGSSYLGIALLIQDVLEFLNGN